MWSLPSIVFGRRLFYFDVGVEIVAGDEPVNEVQMLLPFRVERGEWPDGAPIAQDLFPHISNTDAAELIFGGPVRITDDGSGNKSIRVGDYGRDELHLRRIKAYDIAEVAGRPARDDSSLYTVPLDRPVEPHDSGYFRVRWRVFGAAPLWRWKRLNGSARFDLRFYDVRESTWAGSDFYLRKRMMPIKELNVFLVAPAKYELTTSSPQFRHLRVLEPGAWRGYLRGAAHFNSIGELLVYYWRARAKDTEQVVEGPGPGRDAAGGDVSGEVAPGGATSRDDAAADVAPDGSVPDDDAAADGAAGAQPADTAGNAGAQEDDGGSPTDDGSDPRSPAGSGDGASPRAADPASGGDSGAVTSPGAGNVPRSAARIEPERTDAVHFDSPFRVFVAVARPTARSWWWSLVLVAAGVLLAHGAVNVFHHFSHVHGVKWATWATVLTFFLGTTFVSAVSLFERFRRASASRFLNTRLVARKLERRLLNVNR